MAGSEETTEGALADEFLGQVGARVRALRTERGLTVQQLADRAGVSRRLMTQIELGQANPSLVAVTRVARQLGTEVTGLLVTEPASAVVVRRPEEEVLVWSSDAGSTASLLVATAPGRRADLWRWTLVPGDAYAGQADPARSQELFHVLSGTLTLAADGTEVTVDAGASARLDSDRAYSYRNDGEEPVVFVRVVALGD